MTEGKMLYEAVNPVVVSLVPLLATRVLDVGCGNGELGVQLCRQRAREVVGITYSRREADLAAQRLTAAYCADLNSFDFSTIGAFDCVILSHVLEHLYDPGAVLLRVKAALAPDAVVIVALPNILYWKQRLQFLMGRWRYADGGIMDRTHFRFFDYRSAVELLSDSGYRITKQITEGHVPLKPVRKLLGPLAARIDILAGAQAPGLFAVQFVFVARPV